jgi:predicted ATPase
VIAFLGDSVREDLEPALRKRGGYDRVRFRAAGKKTGGITIEVEAAVTRNSSARAADNYQLDVQPVRFRRRDDNAVLYRPAIRRRETFVFKRTEGPGRRITVEGADISVITDGEPDVTSRLREGSLGLATLPKLDPDKGGEQVDALANLFAGFRVYDVDVAAARRPSEEKASRRLNDDASNLAAFLIYIADEHPQVFSALQEDACAFVPGLEEIQFRPIGGAAAGTVVQLKERSLDGYTELSEASFGSIRALSLLALLYDPAPPRLTCIEEVDHGLHPHVLDRLVELLRSASKKTQLLIATHSPALVNRLNAGELIVCERAVDGSSRIPAISPVEVRRMEKELHGELGLGELWFTGALGGVP